MPLEILVHSWLIVLFCVRVCVSYFFLLFLVIFLAFPIIILTIINYYYVITLGHGRLRGRDQRVQLVCGFHGRRRFDPHGGCLPPWRDPRPRN